MAMLALISNNPIQTSAHLGDTSLNPALRTYKSSILH